MESRFRSPSLARRMSRARTRGLTPPRSPKRLAPSQYNSCQNAGHSHLPVANVVIFRWHDQLNHSFRRNPVQAVTILE